MGFGLAIRVLLFRLCAQGDDGQWYKQLVKSADDLRQDAVMEQVPSLALRCCAVLSCVCVLVVGSCLNW